MNSKVKVGIVSLVTAISFIGCGSSGGSSGTDGISGVTEVTVVDGYIKNATVRDADGQVATYKANGRYSFKNQPVYPISSTGGVIEDSNVSFDINMSVSDGVSTVISPITTFLEDNASLLTKFKDLGLGKSTLDDFSVDYVDTNDTNLSKLSQILYVILKDENLTKTFKQSVENNGTLTGLDKMFTLSSRDVNKTLSAKKAIRMNSLLKKVQDYNGTVDNMEKALGAYKYNTNSIQEANITHNNISYGIVKSPHTGKYWLDRNIGASSVCKDINDTNCFGDYFQWGRDADGHEKSTSGITTTKETTITSTSNSFITALGNYEDWTTADANRTQREARWSATDGSSVCPVGYRVPTETEIKAETSNLNGTYSISNSADLFNSFLGIPAAGYRLRNDGTIGSVGTVISLATTTLGISSDSIKTYDADGSSAAIYVNAGTRSSEMQYGISVRCIKAD